MRLGGVGWGGTPVPGFGCPTTPLGPPSWVSRTCWGMTELGKVGSKVAQRGGGGLQGTPGSGWGCTAPLLVHPSDRTVSGAAHGEEQSQGCEGALAPNIPLK